MLVVLKDDEMVRPLVGMTADVTAFRKAVTWADMTVHEKAEVRAVMMGFGWACGKVAKWVVLSE